jgi:prepilin-type N-terminal cleavage/methylation domain-containing protein
MRGFSLIEVMVAVAILGIFAALAVPSLLPEVHKAQLNGAAESAAGFLARARAEAMLSKRCVRVRVDAGPPTELVMERINSFDCELAAPTAPFIDGSANPFIELARLKPESPSVTFTLSVPPATPGGELRIRPNGRSFSALGSAALGLNNDDAVFNVRHPLITAGSDTRRILYDGNGLICAAARGQALAGGPDFSCP